MWRVMLLLCLGWVIVPVQANPFSILDVHSESVNSAVRYLEDPQGRQTVEALRRDAVAWQNQNGSAFNQGYSASVWWLNLRLRNEAAHPASRYLELSYAVLDYVDVFIFAGDVQVQSYQLGDLYPFSQRPIENRFFVIPLHWEAGQTLDVYYRIKTSTAVQAPLTLWQREAFERQQNNGNIAQGLYYGAMVVIAVYNLLIFLVLWERSYLFYVLFVLSLPLFMASISGHAYHYLWPQAVTWNDHSIPFFLGLAFGSSALFARRFLQVRDWSAWLHKGLSLVAVFAFGCVAMSFVAPYYVSIHLLVPLGLFACVFEMLVGIMAWYKKVPNARYYVIAWLAFLFGGVLLALNKLNVLPTNFLTEYAVQFGSVLEAVLLSFAMAERINVERRLRFEAQDESLRVTRRLNEELEQRVQERTQALELANRKLEELSNTDQLTGLKNRRFLENVLQEEWQRCKRYGRPLSLVMLDIDFFKKVNDEHGHQAGDACLQQVAQRITVSSRWPSDRVARYGGEEFCLVLPETEAEGAATVAERIRAAVAAEPVQTDTGMLQLTVSLGTSSAVPDDDSSVEQLMHCADMALYASKENGRNRVTCFGEADVNNVEPLAARKRT